MTNGVAYKVVRRLEDGRLVSSFIDGLYTQPQLVYEYGKITMQDPESTAGIFCHKTLESAKGSPDISRLVPCTAEVHEVYPIGEVLDYWGSGLEISLVNYPAVLFGRKVADVEG